jgi:inorganic pyrophosphatase
VTVRPVGLLEMRDEKGQDTKILAVPVRDPRFDEVRDLTNVPAHLLREIENFFDTYKHLEGKETQIVGWGGVAEAWRVIEECRARVE